MSLSVSEESNGSDYSSITSLTEDTDLTGTPAQLPTASSSPASPAASPTRLASLSRLGSGLPYLPVGAGTKLVLGTTSTVLGLPSTLWRWVGLSRPQGSGSRNQGARQRRDREENRSSQLSRVEIKLLSGADARLDLAGSTTVGDLRELIFRATGVPGRRQLIIVAEERARGVTMSHIAKRVSRRLAAPVDLRATLISWINFVFLPEAVNRELYGRGLISWAKTSTWYQQLQGPSTGLPLSPAVRIQVETLAGQVVCCDVDAGASLAELAAGVEKRLSILPEQQRLIVLERKGADLLTSVANSVLLQSLAGARCLVGVASVASTALVGLFSPDARFAVRVSTAGGTTHDLLASGETTLDQLRDMVELRETGRSPPRPAGGSLSSPEGFERSPQTAIRELMLPDRPVSAASPTAIISLS